MDSDLNIEQQGISGPSLLDYIVAQLTKLSSGSEMDIIAQGIFPYPVSSLIPFPLKQQSAQAPEVSVLAVFPLCSCGEERRPLRPPHAPGVEAAKAASQHACSCWVICWLTPSAGEGWSSLISGLPPARVGDMTA